jgi:nicotinamidase-related amidase
MQLDKTGAAIVLIEFQREWLDPQGTLRKLLIKDDEDFRAATANAETIVQAARAGGWRVVHAGLDMRDDPNYQLFNHGEGVMGLRAAIPRAETWTGEGAAFVPPFAPRAGEYMVRGRSGASVLMNSTLDPYLRNARVDTLVLLGFALHVCVESSLRQAHDMGYNVLVAADACGVFEPAQRTYFTEHVAHHFGRTVSTPDLTALLAN